MIPQETLMFANEFEMLKIFTFSVIAKIVNLSTNSSTPAIFRDGVTLINSIQPYGHDSIATTSSKETFLRNSKTNASELLKKILKISNMCYMDDMFLAGSNL